MASKFLARRCMRMNGTRRAAFVEYDSYATPTGMMMLDLIGNLKMRTPPRLCSLEIRCSAPGELWRLTEILAAVHQIRHIHHSLKTPL